MYGCDRTFAKKEKTLYWVCFSYERLPDFCYSCGKMGHGHCDCVDCMKVMEKSNDYLYG